MIRKLKRLFTLFLCVLLLIAGIFGFAFYYSTASIRELLTENRRLKKAVHNLTREEQIGYAVLESQTRKPDGSLQSKIRFVQTDPQNPNIILSEKYFIVEGGVVHFDALIVKFTTQYVQDGKERALYLWRRIYGENTRPADGQAIHMLNSHPERYKSITRSLNLKNQFIFWNAIWNLAHDPERLNQYGVKAIFGNTIYIQMQPGKAYLFKISPAGQIYPEVVTTYQRSAK